MLYLLHASKRFRSPNLLLPTAALYVGYLLEPPYNRSIKLKLSNDLREPSFTCLGLFYYWYFISSVDSVVYSMACNLSSEYDKCILYQSSIFLCRTLFCNRCRSMRLKALFESILVKTWEDTTARKVLVSVPVSLASSAYP